jgi:hypothetical protein
MSYEPKHLKPAHIAIIKLHMEGASNLDIALKMDYTPQQVSNILNSQQAQSLIDAINHETVDTMGEVISMAQTHAPWLMDELIKEAVSSPDAKIRFQAKIAALGIAGHNARGLNVNIRQTHQTTPYDGKSEEEIRKMIYEGEPVQSPGMGPDGKPLQ